MSETAPEKAEEGESISSKTEFFAYETLGGVGYHPKAIEVLEQLIRDEHENTDKLG